MSFGLGVFVGFCLLSFSATAVLFISDSVPQYNEREYQAGLAEARVEPAELAGPVFNAWTVNVNDLLERPFTDAQVECVVIHAQTERAEVLMAGPCVTTYP